VLERGTRLPLVPPPEPAKLELGKPSSIVMQAVMPEARTVLEKSAYKVPAGQTSTIPIFLYNFGAKPARGRLSTPMSFNSTRPLVSPPWEAELPSEVEVAPGERKELALRLTGVSTNGVEAAAIRIIGEFGVAGRAVLSLNVVPIVN
jgi:hypothetical protein